MAEEHTLVDHAPEPALTSTEAKPGSYIATVALVGLGVALFEVELIPGMLIGVAAMLFPKMAPRLGNMVRPLVTSAVRAGVAVSERAKETVAEATEQFQDIVAEVRAEQDHGRTQNGRSTAGHPERPDAHSTTGGADLPARETASSSTQPTTEQTPGSKQEEGHPRGKRSQS